MHFVLTEWVSLYITTTNYALYSLRSIRTPQIYHNSAFSRQSESQHNDRSVFPSLAAKVPPEPVFQMLAEPRAFLLQFCLSIARLEILEELAQRHREEIFTRHYVDKEILQNLCNVEVKDRNELGVEHELLAHALNARTQQVDQ